MKPLAKKAFLPLVPLLITVIAYINVFYVGYVWDDNLFLIQGIRSFEHFSLLGGKGVYYRPLIGLTLAIDHALWGWKPWGYHLTNLLFHCINVLLVFWIVYLLLGDFGDRSWIAASAALFFGLYPLNTEPVCWISGRTDLMAFTFFALAVAFHLLYLKKSKFWLVLLSSFAFLLSLFSKEVGIAFVFLVPFLEPGGLDGPDFKWKKAFLSYSFYGAVVLLYLFLRKASLHPVTEKLLAGATLKISRGGEGRPVLDALSAIGFYVRRAVWPFKPVLFIGNFGGVWTEFPGSGSFWCPHDFLHGLCHGQGERKDGLYGLGVVSLYGPACSAPGGYGGGEGTCGRSVPLCFLYCCCSSSGLDCVESV